MRPGVTAGLLPGVTVLQRLPWKGFCMLFLVYSPVSSDTLRNHLGKAEYSYHFVLRGFLPVLEQLGEVVEITDPATEADALFHEARDRGEQCRLLCFCPPHRAPVGLDVPTTVVLAWEYESIPDQAWHGDERNDWRHVLSDHGQAICLSTHTRDAIHKAMGGDFQVDVIPVPVFDRMPEPPQIPKPPLQNTRLQFQGRLIDTRELLVTPDSVELADPLAFTSHEFDGRRQRYSFEDGGIGQNYLMGFYNAEPWGAWSRVSDPSVMLPYAVSGRVKLKIRAVGYGYNIGRSIDVVVGGARQSITLTDQAQDYSMTLDVARPTNLITFSTLDARSYPGTFDTRSMGMGLLTMSIQSAGRGLRGLLERGNPKGLPRAADPQQSVDLDGVVYTAVLNPQDGRKNWHDIVSAFAAAFREEPRATLVLKMTHHSISSFVMDMLTDLRVVWPIAARVVAVHGFLSDEDMNTLRNGTSYYVCASHAEGLCLPLMEFMSAGVPAVSVDHTAMADYVTDESTFIVASGECPMSWPQDPEKRLRTLHYRINWESLVEQFKASFEVATADPDRYARMSIAAREGQRRFAADAVVAESLRHHLAAVTV